MFLLPCGQGVARPGPGSPAAAPVASGPQHNTQSAAGQQLVPGHRSLHSSQYTEEEWRSENCVMVPCIKKIGSLKVFSIETFLILSLCSNKIDTSHDNSSRNYDT